MTSFKSAAVLMSLFLVPEIALAQDSSGKTIFYVGGGAPNSADAFTDGSTPYSIGIMHQMADRKLMLGFDLAGEGTSLDSTWGQSNQPTQATSFNFLVGSNLADDGQFRVDAALLVGLRDSASSCAPSFLGFQCYADADPSVEYNVNFGGVIAVSMNKLVLGLRATGESTQLVAGIKF